MNEQISYHHLFYIQLKLRLQNCLENIDIFKLQMSLLRHLALHYAL